MASRDVRRRRRPEKKSPAKASAAPASPSLLSRLAAELLPRSSSDRKILLGLLALSFVLRAYNLLGMFPVLVDEAIYLRWAEIIDHQGQWLISLLDGKPVLSYWLLALQRMIFGGDPLYGARLLSAAAGVFSTIGLFAVARRLAPMEAAERAGLIGAGLYAVFPYALLYDRLAYTEAWINLVGIMIALTSLWCFSREEGDWRLGLVPGIVFGLGIFTKQTAVLFGLVPAAMALWFTASPLRTRLARLATVYAVGIVFVAANFALTPEAPMLETHDAVLHHTGFFADSQELMKDPLVAARSNFPKLASYAGTYLGWPLILAAAAGAVWLGRSGSPALWLLLSCAIIPVVVEAFLLELMFPSRYPFPHFWPWLAVAAAGVAAAWERMRQSEIAPTQRRATLAAAALALVGPMLYRDAFMLATPREGLHVSDAAGFLGDHAHVGYGIRKALDFLIAESGKGGFILLTDPIWGPPSDAVFPYLNERNGIRVYEAWWTQLSGNHEILPRGGADVLKSHYERVKAGVVDFSRAERVFYLTDTYYYNQQAVLLRQPNAQLVARFKKPVGDDSIDVYRLK